jgi:hypothetical protein
MLKTLEGNKLNAGSFCNCTAMSVHELSAESPAQFTLRYRVLLYLMVPPTDNACELSSEHSGTYVNGLVHDLLLCKHVSIVI